MALQVTLCEAAAGSSEIFQQHHVVSVHSLGEGERPAIRGRHDGSYPGPPIGISCKTLGPPVASIERSANAEPDCASANQPFPFAAQLTLRKDDHFQSRTGTAVTLRSARFRIRILAFSSPRS